MNSKINENKINEISSYLKSLLDLEILSPKEYENKLSLVKKKYKNNFDYNQEKLLQEPIIRVVNFTKKYKGQKVPVLKDISFNIFPGRFHAFIGANGAGKTTTIKSIIGAYSKHNCEGNITIKNMSNQIAESEKEMGYVPEYAQFPKKIKVIEYLSMMIMLYGYSKKESKEMSYEILKKINMLEFAQKRPFNLSSGQKKKILLAQSMICNPDIIIMDEPAANLDPLAREEMFNILLELQKEGKSIFLSSHILDELSKYADYVTILDSGTIVFDGPVEKNSDLSFLYKKYIQKNY